MGIPLQSDIWSRLFVSAAALREGDLAGIGALDQALEQVDGQGAGADVAALRAMAAEMLMAEGERFQQLHSALQRAVAAAMNAPAGGAGSPPRAAVSAPAAAPVAPPAPKAGLPAFDDAMDTDLFLEFVDESLSHLQSIELNVLAMETEPGNRKYIDNIFRPFHTIKGVSGFLNLRPIHEVCHDLESLLDDARRGRIAVLGDVSDVVLDAVDLLQKMIEGCRNSDQPRVAMEPYSTQVKAFLGRVGQVRKAALEAPRMSTDEAIRGNADKLAHTGTEPVTGAPAATSAPPETPERPPAHSDPPAVADPAAANAMFTPPTPHEGRSEMNAEPSAGDPRAKQASGENTETVRVRVGLLNQLMNLAGELVLGRNQLLQKLSDRADQVGGLNAILQHVDRVTSEVQEAVMQTRMQPIGGLFSRFHRVTRDLARSLGKQIDLSLTGESVELDKSLIEALTDPLTHLIRNCADHGIEKPEARQAQGKRATGSIALSAHQEGGKVRIVVSDDGAGVNIERVKQKAMEKGLATREQAQHMSEREAIQLLFAPGFSTAEQVTGVSGRGVGMDVVRENVERIGGTVEIESRQGQGTTFHLDLPLTLAIIPALIVTAGDQRFAIPQVNLLELVHLEAGEGMKDLLKVGDTEVYRLRGEMLPVLRLGRIMGLEEDQQRHGQELSIAVVAAGDEQYGLVVDRIFDTEEIVVKPLGNLLKHLQLYLGATLMGDGRPALILDMAGLAKTAHLTLNEETSFGARAAEAEERTGAEDQSLLLFTVNPNEQFAVPLSLVSRLEEVPADRIVDSLQGKVIQYRGRLLPLIMLEELTPIGKPAADRATVTVVVFEIEREVGLVVTRIVDAVKASVQLDTQSMAQPGYAGVALLQDKPTSFIDIYQLIELAFPHWFQRQKTGVRKSVDPANVTILLAEDSGFYRTVEKNYLVQEGFNVLDAQDGAQALETLGKTSVDLVITDIEMPNMDGFELTRRIRADHDLKDLPVIAVTSLANESDRQAGKQAGVDSYLVKLQREQLLQEVMRLLSLPGGKPAQKVS